MTLHLNNPLENEEKKYETLELERIWEENIEIIFFFLILALLLRFDCDVYLETKKIF